MDIRILQEFVSLSQHLKLTTAAEELYISAPTLSQHISGLERELGLTLFSRKNGLSLTQEGEDALKIVQRLLLEWHKLESLATSRHSNVTLRYPHYSYGFDILLEAKRLYLEKHPGSSLYIERNGFQQENPFALLEENKADLSLLFLMKDSGKTVTDYLKPGFSAIRIRSSQVSLVSTTKHALPIRMSSP